MRAVLLSNGLTREFFRGVRLVRLASRARVLDDRPPQPELAQDAFRHRKPLRQHLIDEPMRDAECFGGLAEIRIFRDEDPQSRQRVDVDFHTGESRRLLHASQIPGFRCRLPGVSDVLPPVIIYLSLAQKRQLLAGLPADTAIFNLTNGSFYVPALSHVLFWPVETPDQIHPRHA